MSGIKPHTIRIWEQRHNLLTPTRTESNFRTYSPEDVRYLIRLGGLNANGHKISALANMSREDITKEFEDLRSRTMNPEVFIKCLLIDMLNLDERSFKHNLEFTQSRIGFDDTCTEVCLRLIEKCSLVLSKRKVASCYEHFAHALMRDHFLKQRVEPLNVPRDFEAKTFVLFLLESDSHECGLLFIAHKLRCFGHRVLYLGFDIRPENLKEISEVEHVDFYVTTVHEFIPKAKIKRSIKKMCDEMSDAATLVAIGKEAESFLPEGHNAAHISMSMAEALINFKDLIVEMNGRYVA